MLKEGEREYSRYAYVLHSKGIHRIAQAEGSCGETVACTLAGVPKSVYLSRLHPAPRTYHERIAKLPEQHPRSLPARPPASLHIRWRTASLHSSGNRRAIRRWRLALAVLTSWKARREHASNGKHIHHRSHRLVSLVCTFAFWQAVGSENKETPASSAWVEVSKG